MATYFAVMVRRPIERTSRSSDVDQAHSQYLHAMEKHARGLGDKAEKRRIEGAPFRCRAIATGEDGKPLEWRSVRRGEQAPQVALRKAWRNHMKAHDAKLRANARMGEHFILSVTPEWLEANGGSRHDITNPRVGKLVKLAVKWVRTEFGGVFAARYDCDERGAVVDVFAAPIRKQGRKGSERNYVAVTQAHQEVAKRGGRYHSFAALHDSWHQACITELDPAIQRGRPIGQGGRTHEDTDAFKERMDGISQAASAEVERKRSELESIEATATAKRNELAAIEAHLADLRAKRRRWLKRGKLEVARNKLVNRAVRHAAKMFRAMAEVGETGPELIADLTSLTADADATMAGDADALRRLNAIFGDEVRARQGVADHSLSR